MQNQNTQNTHTLIVHDYEDCAAGGDMKLCRVATQDMQVSSDKRF